MQLTIDRVGKTYRGGVRALSRFSLDLKPGVLGLLGPNGAGKTTLMNILATVTRPTDGQVTWNGSNIVKDPDSVRSVLGYLPQDFGIYPNLNAVEFLHYLAALKGVSTEDAKRRVDELIQLVNLTDVARRPLKTYSGGLKQRVGIAQALLNDPKLLIVDEPTVGLDPHERVRFRNLLSELSGERIVILSTHIVSDVEAVATRIVLINQGQLLDDTTPEKLLSTVDGKVWLCVIDSEELTSFRRQRVISSVLHRSDGVHVRVVADSPPNDSAKAAPPTMEDAYLYSIASSQHDSSRSPVIEQ
jgi:ABC-type multidrug transport system ATPase subunit